MVKYKVNRTILVLVLIVCLLMPHTQGYSIEYFGTKDNPFVIHEPPQSSVWISSFWDVYCIALISFTYNVRSFAIRKYAAFNKHDFSGALHFYKYSYERNHSGLIQYFDVSILLKTSCNRERSICWLYEKDGKK